GAGWSRWRVARWHWCRRWPGHQPGLGHRLPVHDHLQHRAVPGRRGARSARLRADVISTDPDVAAVARRRPSATTLAARYVALDAETVLAPGVVSWSADGRIVALRRARRSDAVRDLAVLPGLVNAHAHLQIEPLPHVERAFLPWIDAVMAARSQRQSRDYRRAALQAMRELLASG